jgi:hypothetical protein
MACNAACVGGATSCGAACCTGDQGCCNNACMPLNTTANCRTCGASCNPNTQICTASGCQGIVPDGKPCGADRDCVSGACFTYYRDADNDSWGDLGAPGSFCGSPGPPGYSTIFGDCDDNTSLLSQSSSICSSSSIRTYCLTDGIRRTQTCAGGGCIDSYCLGTVGIAGTFTCDTALQCTTSQGCSWSSSPNNPAGSPPACNMTNGPSLMTCDDSSDCPAGQVCCSAYNCSLTGTTTCQVDACPVGGQCNAIVQLCNPLAPDCPAGLTCRFGFGNIESGQGSWTCLP